LLVHAAAIILLLLLSFTIPDPPPVEKGILLDLGGAGSGTPNPGPSSPSSSDAQHNASSQHTPVSGSLTQDLEEAPALPSGNNPDNQQLTPEEIQRREKANKISNLTQFGNGSPGNGVGPGSGLPGSNGDGSTPGDGGGPGGVGGNVGSRKISKIVEPMQKPDMFGKVILSYLVNEQGVVSNISVVSSNCAECTSYAITALSQWKYEPLPGAKLQKGQQTFNFSPK